MGYPPFGRRPHGGNVAGDVVLGKALAGDSQYRYAENKYFCFGYHLNSNEYLMEKFMFTCPICGNKFQHGPHLYEGYKLQWLGETVCNICSMGNRDGWAPAYEPRVLELIEREGLIVPKRDDNEMIPFDFDPQHAE